MKTYTAKRTIPLTGLPPPKPASIPQPTDESPCGISFFRTYLGGDDEEELVLENLTLPRTFICKSEVNSVCWSNCDLSESFICWNDVVDTEFANADLTRADMRACRFKNVSFKNAKLVETDFRHSNFVNCDFSGADLKDCKLHLAWVELLELSPDQRRVIAWCKEEGPEPPGG